MSRRELQSLLTDPYLQAAVDLTTFGTSERRQTRSRAMAENNRGDNVVAGEEAASAELLQRVQHLESCLRQAQSVVEESAAELELTRRELRRANDKVAEQREEAEHQQGYAESLNSELETVQLRMELEKLRTIESLRQEHQSQVEREKLQLERECRRADSWVEDLREQFKAERQHYLDRISELELQLSRAVGSGHGTEGAENEPEHTQLQSVAYVPDPTTVEGSCQEQPETLVLQEVQLPEVRSGVVNSYPCEYERWGTPPPRVHG